MKSLKIFPKTFLYTLSLMLIIILISHLLIYFLLPQAYDKQQEMALKTDVERLVEQIMSSPEDEWLKNINNFAAKWSANTTVSYNDFSYSINLFQENSGTPLSSNNKSDVTIISNISDNGLNITLAENPLGGTEVFNVEQIFAGGAGSIIAVVSRHHIEDIVNSIIMILPITFLLCVIISVLFALLYSKMITKPIRQISIVTEQMRNLNPIELCRYETDDEIGKLAENINELYRTLLTVIQELKNEIKKVETADLQKTNFLRAASHELKTPITAINVMLENMILGVGKYKDNDKDTYLNKCKIFVDKLSQMIREILDISKDGLIENKEYDDLSISEVLNSVMEPYKIIAKANGIQINTEINSFNVHLPKSLIEKILSNILANAVLYTEHGKTIYIICKNGKLTIENECSPISDENLIHIFEPFYKPDYGRNRTTGGNGLGLYIVATLIKSLNLSYSFLPSTRIKGMSFQIIF